MIVANVVDGQATIDALPMSADEPILASTDAPVSGRDAMKHGALLSSALSNWGSPELLRRFGAAILRPAASGKQSIDLDASSSAYWHEQWAAKDRPREFFDGSHGRDVMSDDDWMAAQRRLSSATSGEIGAVYENAPSKIAGSEALGSAVQRIWGKLVELHKARRIGSVFWVGFSLEPLRTLIPSHVEAAAGVLHPLSPSFCTVLPGKRIAYLVHPDEMIAIIDKKIATYKSRGAKGKAEVVKLEKRRAELAPGARSDDSPVKGESPTHSTFLTILWHHSKSIRAKQQAAMRSFLDEQAKLTKSELYTSATVGDVGGKEAAS